LVGGAILVVAALMVALLDEIFGRSLSMGDLRTLAQMTMVMAACLAISVALNPIGALIIAAEKFTFLRLLEMAVHIGSTALIVVLLQQGFGPVMAVACSGGTLVVMATTKLAYARWVLRANI